MGRSNLTNIDKDPARNGDAKLGEQEGDEPEEDVAEATPEVPPAAPPDSIARLEADLERAKEVWRDQVERGAVRERRRLRFRRGGGEDRQAVALRQALSDYGQAWQALERARAETKPKPDAEVKAADPPAATAAPEPNTVSLSSANLDQLRELGMSTTQANRVIRYRDKHGDFSEVEELRQVGGFPAALLERIAPRVAP